MDVSYRRIATEEAFAPAELLDCYRRMLRDGHGDKGFQSLWGFYLGSTAERVVQHSPCPVLVVRQHLRHWNGAVDLRTRTGFELSKILVPTDFSECSQIAFEYGLQLARDFNAELRLVHVD